MSKENQKAKEIANSIEMFFMKNKRVIQLLWIIVFLSFLFLISKSLWWISKEDLESRLVPVEFETTYKEDLMLFQWSTRIEKKWIEWIKKEYFDEQWIVHYTELNCEECKKPSWEVLVKWKFSVDNWELTVKQEFNNFLFWLKNRNYKEALNRTSYFSRKNVTEKELLKLEWNANFKFWDFIIENDWIKANLSKTDTLTVDIKAKTSYFLEWLWDINELISLEAKFNKKLNKWEFDYPFIFKKINMSSKKITWYWEKSATINKDRLVVQSKLNTVYKKLIWDSIAEFIVISSVPFESIKLKTYVWYLDRKSKNIFEIEDQTTEISLKEFWTSLYDVLNSKQETIKKGKRKYIRKVYIPISTLKENKDFTKYTTKYVKFEMTPEAIWYDLPSNEIKSVYTSIFRNK